MKSIIVTIALASASLATFASEYTNFTTPSAGEMTRAEVRDQAASRILGRDMHYVGDAVVFDTPRASAMTRAEAASRVLGRAVIYNEATTFVDETSANARAAKVPGRSSM